MKKIVISTGLILSSLLGYSQTEQKEVTKMRAFSSVEFTSSGWSDMEKLTKEMDSVAETEKSSVLITLDVELRRIKVYTDVVHALDIVSKKTDISENGNTSVFYTCVDEQGLDCLVSVTRLTSGEQENSGVIVIMYREYSVGYFVNWL